MHGGSTGDAAQHSGALLTGALSRDHSWPKCIFWSCGLSLCITVDILQYSMPLAFLPSVLEDQGHSTFMIASCIGVYYWTGFAGGLCITSYQIWRVLYGREVDEGAIMAATVKRHIIYLFIGLTVGAITLGYQALNPTYYPHMICRFIQGFVGAFIFFYTFLLSSVLFKGQQQIFAMTAASTALNVAEVLGSFFGALIFETYGQSTVFWFLAVVSVLNQVLLVIIYFMVNSTVIRSPRGVDAEWEEGHSQNQQRQLRHSASTIFNSGLKRLTNLLKSPLLGCAVLTIFTSAIVKGSVEEMLPFHADHQWGYTPMQIGQLFAIIAIAYIIAAMSSGKLWSYLGSFRLIFTACWIVFLGASSYAVFLVYGWNKDQNYLYVALAFYGVCLGATHTPAALLLAEAIEHESKAATKDAVNGIWNTMWEGGGSLGFLLGGLLAHHYQEQVYLTLSYTVVCVVSGGLLVFLGQLPVTKPKSDSESLISTSRQPSGRETPLPDHKSPYGSLKQPTKSYGGTT